MTESQRSILRSVGTVTVLTLGVKSIGLVQQVMVAGRFGTGGTIEAYFLSLAIPGLLADLIPSTLTAGLLPVFLLLREKEGEDRAMGFLGACFGNYLIGLLGIAGVVAVAAGPVVSALAGRPLDHPLIIHLSWAAAPLIVLAGLYSTLSAIQNSQGRFFMTTAWRAAPAVAIMVCLALLPALGVWSIAVGMLLGMAAQLAAIGVSVRRALPRFRLLPGVGDPAFRDVRARMAPLFLSSMIVQLNPIVDQLMASTLPAGSLSALAYADRIIRVFQALLISSVSTVGLVTFSRQISARAPEELVLTLHNLVRVLAFVLIPLSAGTILVARPLVAVLFQRGAFGAGSTEAVSQALIFFCLGLFPMGVSFLIPQAFVAVGATRTLAVVSVGENILNVVLNLILMKRFAHAGIAFSTSLVYALGIMALAGLLPRALPQLRWRPLAGPLLKTVAATVFMIVICLLVGRGLAPFGDTTRLVALAITGGTSYLAAARLLRIEELGNLAGLLRARPAGA